MKKLFIVLIVIVIIAAGLLMGRSFTESQNQEIGDLEAMYRVTAESADDFNLTFILENAHADDNSVSSFTVSECRTIIVEPEIGEGSVVKLMICDEDAENFEDPLLTETVDSNEPLTMEIDPGDYNLYAVVVSDDANGKIDITNEWVRYSTEAMDWLGWTDKGSAQEAADECYFESFSAAEGVSLSIGAAGETSYKSYGGISARADMNIGEAHICILKQWAVGDDDFFVYCDTYPCREELEIEGTEGVTVYGDKPGEFSKADWYDDDIEYKVLVYRADGTSYGLSKEDITLLVRGVK